MTSATKRTLARQSNGRSVVVLGHRSARIRDSFASTGPPTVSPTECKVCVVAKNSQRSASACQRKPAEIQRSSTPAPALLARPVEFPPNARCVMNGLRSVCVSAICALVVGCGGGSQGPAGAEGPPGEAGSPGEQGASGEAGAPGRGTGTDGTNGTNGTSGEAGSSGTPACVVSSTEPAGTNCQYGGVALTLGPVHRRRRRLERHHDVRLLPLADGHVLRDPGPRLQRRQRVARRGAGRRGRGQCHQRPLHGEGLQRAPRRPLWHLQRQPADVAELRARVLHGATATATSRRSTSTRRRATPTRRTAVLRRSLPACTARSGRPPDRARSWRTAPARATTRTRSRPRTTRPRAPTGSPRAWRPSILRTSRTLTSSGSAASVRPT